jgi:hypothetical protein
MLLPRRCRLLTSGSISVALTVSEWSPMVHIKKIGLLWRRSRVISDAAIREDEFWALVGQADGNHFRARKSAPIAARRVSQPEVLTTIWNGAETLNRAETGDWIATTLGSDGTALRDRSGNVNEYVIKAERFQQLYAEAAGQSVAGSLFEARGEVVAIYFAGGFDIVAPWGERQEAASGYLLLNGGEVYGNAKETFEMTYTPVSDIAT